jgi:hypothetical protein
LRSPVVTGPNWFVTTIEPAEAVARFPELARLGRNWTWELSPTRRVQLWGTYASPALQVGLFIYLDGTASLVALEWGQLATQHTGPLRHMVTNALELLDRPVDPPT